MHTGFAHVEKKTKLEYVRLAGCFFSIEATKKKKNTAYK